MNKKFQKKRCLLWIVPILALGCQQKMADQPSYKTLTPCQFFPEGCSERPLAFGVVPRGQPATDVVMQTGRRTGPAGEPRGEALPAMIQPPPYSPEAAKAKQIEYDDFEETFPFAISETVLQHGYERFMIYCVVCHDPLGTGQGKIVERGYTRPPSFHTDRLRAVPAGYLFAVMSEGYGSMPSYRAQIPIHDRWAIAAYLRALQASQHFPEADARLRLRKGEEGEVEVVASGQWLVASEEKGVGSGQWAVDRNYPPSAIRHPLFAIFQSPIPNPSPTSPHPSPLPVGEGTTGGLSP